MELVRERDRERVRRETGSGEKVTGGGEDGGEGVTEGGEMVTEGGEVVVTGPVGCASVDIAAIGIDTVEYSEFGKCLTRFDLFRKSWSQQHCLQ